MGRVFINDIGVDVIVSTCINLTGSTGACILMRKPSGSSVSWSASLSGAASGGMVQYETAASSDLDEAGLWLGHARVAFGTEVFTGQTFELHVWNPFER